MPKYDRNEIFLLFPIRILSLYRAIFPTQNVMDMNICVCGCVCVRTAELPNFVAFCTITSVRLLLMLTIKGLIWHRRKKVPVNAIDPIK